MTSRPSTAAPILAVLAIVLVMLLGAYVAGYFVLGSYRRATSFNGEMTWVELERSYPSRSLATAYIPLASLESWLTGSDVKAIEVDLYGE